MAYSHSFVTHTTNYVKMCLTINTGKFLRKCIRGIYTCTTPFCVKLKQYDMCAYKSWQ